MKIVLSCVTSCGGDVAGARFKVYPRSDGLQIYVTCTLCGPPSYMSLYRLYNLCAVLYALRVILVDHLLSGCMRALA